MKITNELAGKFRLVAVNADTGKERVLADWFDNLILDAGLDRIGSDTIGIYCQVGSGSTAPVSTNTALNTHVAGTGSITAESHGTSDVSPYYGYLTRTYRFAQGAAAGNLSEVGIGWGISGSTLFSRALIKDGSGNPTTITVLSNEYLDVTYELRNYPSTTDSTFTCVIGGVTHNCTLRSAYVTDITSWGNQLNDWPAQIQNGTSVHFVRNGSLGAITSGPSGEIGMCSSFTNGTYTQGSYTNAGTINFNLASGNLSGGISALVFRTYIGSFQVSFSPPIAKDNTKTLSINVTVSWARKSL